MLLTDTLTIDAAPRKTADGYLVASVKAARAGIQIYCGADVGRPELGRVRVYRPPEEVFSNDAMRSYAHRPITVGHRGAVNAGNWKDVAAGQTGDEVMRDGEFVRVPLILMDATAIKVVESGTRELSMGYDCTLEFKDGTAPDGQPYDAIQRSMKMNHLAIVAAARGGSDLRIGDGNQGEADMADIKTKTVTVDGLSVETTDAGAQAIEKLQRDLTTAKAETATAQRALADAQAAHKTEIGIKDGEIVALKKQVQDAAITPEKLDAAVKVRAAIVADAKAIAGDKLGTDGKTDIEIRRAAVAAKMGDEAAKAMSDAEIIGAFRAYVPVKDGNAALRDALGTMQAVGDGEKTANEARATMIADMQSAHRPKAAA